MIIIKQFCRLARKNTPRRVPCDMLSHGVTISICPLPLHMVWLLVKVYQHTQFGYKEINLYRNIGFTNIQSSFEPSLSP